MSAEDAGEGFLLDTSSRRYYRLNGAGLTVWQALETQRDPLAALAARHPGVDHDRLAGDVEGIVARLLDAGLVRRA